MRNISQETFKIYFQNFLKYILGIYENMKKIRNEKYI